VSALIAQFSDGPAISYAKFRYIVLGHVIDDSKSDDAIAFFSIEGFHGGNYNAEYMAVFAAVEPDFFYGKVTHSFRLVSVIQIGGRGWRTFDWKTAVLRPNRITVSGWAWGDRDPMCCASKPITVTFRVVNDNLVENRAPAIK